MSRKTRSQLMSKTAIAEIAPARRQAGGPADVSSKISLLPRCGGPWAFQHLCGLLSGPHLSVLGLDVCRDVPKDVLLALRRKRSSA
eukprot:5877846-Alexandrium_andersonii.AAC.1